MIAIKEIVSPDEILQISVWLENDYDKKTGTGLFANWKVIEADIHKGVSLIICLDEKPIGFLTYLEYGHLTTIKYVAIDKRFRKSGFARQLVIYFLVQQKTKGTLIVDLYASPPEMQSFWKKLGFKDALKSFSAQGPRLYQQLVTGAKPIKPPVDGIKGKFVQLWKNDPHYARKTPADFTWQLDDEDSSGLINPIIAPCLPDWRIRHVVDGQSVFDQKITKFKSQIYFNDFLIIEQI